MNNNCQCISQETNENCMIYKSDYGKWVLSIESRYDFQYDEQEYAEVEVEYCPFCGRKLK